ncbi:MAG: long-chain-acyl-CoA synthetase [Bauldia sp.]|nr:long-chain-acyl-CoA synthetase [Bauldia sp.]
MRVLDRIRSDFAFTTILAATLARIIPLAHRRTRVLPDVIENLAAKYGERPALLSDDETLTYAGLDARANRYARWAITNGVRKGDTVCLLMPNRPEFPAVWLGVARAGGVTALLNTNLAGEALAYCINIVKPKHIIVADELGEVFKSAATLVEGTPRVWRHGGSAASPERIDTAILALDDGPIPKGERPALAHDDRCLYIYTSGTTGMPKAANINHYRVLAAMVAFASVMGASERDRMYDCLPLYHTVGGVIAVGAPLMVGGSVFIARKFSARRFWDDVVDNGCTLFQYVGELCRYLLNAPPHPREAEHGIRLVCGNGLRPDIWSAFKQRFRIPHIREFYAATEGNAIMFNLDETPGSIGRCPFWTSFIFPMAVVRFDVDLEMPIRGAEGFCQRTGHDEVGELVSRIVFDPMKPGQRFDGYADRAAGETKILRDVFEKGDMWFRTGDLVRRDRNGYFFFVDRIGDTFRWKGENVATAEIAETIHTMEGVEEANVFGVPIPGYDGKAGMAAIVPGRAFDLDRLHAHVHARLAPFARPLFLRLRKSIDATSTFKQKKIDLVREGFDPVIIADPLYFDDPRSETYLAIDAALYAEILSGTMRL